MEITKENLLSIKEKIQIELLKRGITAPIKTIEYENNKLKVVTEDFQTNPVIFKRLWVQTWNSFIDKIDNNITLFISLNYRYEHFNGGSNGCDLFSINFIITGGSMYDVYLKNVN